MFNRLKGGLKKMARNLVKEREEQREADEAKSAKLVKPVGSDKEEVRIITWEALIANNIEQLHVRMDSLEKKIMEGFKQVGVQLQEEE